MNAPNRRTVLAASAGLLGGLSGCASIAGRFQSDGETQSGGTTPRQSDLNGTTTTQSTTADPTTANRTTTETGVGRIDIDSSEVSFEESLLPADPGSRRYARLGSSDAPTATIYGNWKCPYTREFVLTQMPGLVKEFVEPGDLAFRFRSVAYIDGDPFLGPDAPRASRAGLAVWSLDPDAYWTYFGLVFTNQPQERYEWATVDRLVRFAEEAGVESPSEVRSAIEAGAYEAEVQATAQSSVVDSISAVPRVVANGTVTAPTLDVERTRRHLRRAAEQQG